MKKILSTFLSLAIILTTVLSIPFFTTAVITNPVIGESTKIFDSTGDTTYAWLTKDTTNSDDTEAWSKATSDTETSITIQEKDLTTKILASNASDDSVTDVENFIWEFDYKTSAWARTAFLFHVNESSSVSHINDASCQGLSNTFGVVFVNRNTSKGEGNYTASKILRPMAWTVIVPNAETGVAEPLDAATFSDTDNYGDTKANKYTNTGELTLAGENGYMSLAGEGFTEFSSVTWHVKIGLIGRVLTLSVTEGSTTLTKEFVLPGESYALASSGDFVISNGNCDATISNMTVSEIPVSAQETGLIFDTTELEADDTTWINNGNDDIVVGSNTFDTDPTYDESTGAVKLNNTFASTKILEHNGYSSQDISTIDDFIWEFEFIPADFRWVNVSFLFHLNENSTLPTGTSYSRNNITNAMGVSLFGPANTTKDYYIPNSVRIDAAGAAAGSYLPAQYYTSTASGSSVITPISGIALSENYTISSGSTYNTYFKNKISYSVRIIYKDGSLTFAIWETDNKEATYQICYNSYNNNQISAAPSGDFAIVSGNTACYIKNMKIYKGTEAAEITDEDFAEYKDFATEYTFDTEPTDIYATAGSTGSIKYNSTDGTLDLYALEYARDENWNFLDADGNIVASASDAQLLNQALWARGFDNGNHNLGDFVLKLDWQDGHNWTQTRFSFRRATTSENYYAVTINKNGTSATDTNTHHTIRISKFIAGSETVIKTFNMAKSIHRGTPYTIMIKAIGNQIDVYFAPKGTVLDTPILSVTDDTYTTGILEIRHSKDIVKLDNISIYDITAYNVANKIDAKTGDNVKRGMDKEIFDLSREYLSLHPAKRTKLAAQKAALDAAKATLDEIEFNAHDANATGDIDIRDLVALRNHIADGKALANSDADPVFDDILNADDIQKTRDWVLGVDDKINILAIGNSYTQDSMKYVAQIADSMGIDNYHFANMFYPGRSVSGHFSAAMGTEADYAYETYTKDGILSFECVTIKEALEDKDWDIVFFQTSPTGAASANGYTNLDSLIEYIRSVEGQDVKFMWQNSWSYATHDYPETFTYEVGRLNESGAKFADENGKYSQQLMDEMIIETLETQLVNGAYADVIGKEGIIPVGLAIKLARESGVDFELTQESRYWDLTRDGYHLSYNMGRYIGALTLIRQFTGSDLVYSDGIYNTLASGSATETQLKAAIDVVNAAFVERDALGTN